MSALVASSTHFDLDTLEPFLVRVSGLIPCGFGDMEIAQVLGTAERLRPHEEDELAFYIEYEDEPSRFRIVQRLDDAGVPDVRFFAPRGLAERIEAEIRRTDEA
jgi:hypothetical protein